MTKYSSQTSVVKVGDGAGGFIVVGNATNVRDIRSGTAAEEDVSDLSSTAVETMLHLPDSGAFSFDLLFDPGDPGQARIKTLYETVPIPLENWRIEFTPANVKYDGQGRVQTFPFTLATATAARASVTVRVSGAFPETPL